MSRVTTNVIRILAIDPAPRGIGFAVMEGPERLIDWGVKATKTNKQARSVRAVCELIEHYAPDVVIVEDYRGKGSRRSRRIQRLIREIEALAARKKLRCRRFAPAKVRTTFAPDGRVNKHQIATAIASQFPELAPRLPPVRKPWMTEDYRMSIFDAVAFGLTFFDSRDKRKRVA